MVDTPQRPENSMWNFSTEEDDRSRPARAVHKAAPAPQTSNNDDVDELVNSLAEKPEQPRAPQVQAPAPLPAPSANRSNLRLFATAAIAVIAIGATSFMLLKSSPEAAGASSAVIADRTNIAPVETTPQQFQPDLSTHAISISSLSQFLEGPSPIPPVPAMRVADWRGAECSSCHTWTQTRLCDQGKWYDKHGDAAVNRIAHPYDGDFKRSLVNWAKDGCQ